MAASFSSTVATESADERGMSVASLTYRPQLDGLRAVAVYLVVLFHAGVERFSGGFIGVDVFFVLSGFLVTHLLLRDLSATGAVRFRRFYARRFRRLLPAAFVALLITAAVFAAISPVEALAATSAFKSAFLYSANWFFIREATGYFGAGVNSNPVLHFWSLAVEEQFYLLWPLLLTGLYWLTRRRPRTQASAMRAVVAAAALASLAWALSLRGAHPNHAYYGTDARAYQLLAGALIALTPGLSTAAARASRAVRLATIVCLGALILLASSVIDVDAIERGVAVTLVVCLLLVVLEAADAGVGKRILSSEPLVYLGKVSYGTYLWHWPVIIVAQRLWGLGSAAIVGVVCLVATGLASVSFQLLERPVRASTLLERHRGAVIASGLLVSFVSALIFVPTLLEARSTHVSSVAASATSGFTPIPRNLDFAKTYREFYGKTKTCVGLAPDACTIVHGTGRHVLLMGDSNAEMMVPTFTKIARREHLTLSLAVTVGCPWQRGLYRLTTEIKRRCRKNKEDAYQRVIPALRPDLIVLIDSHEAGDHSPGVLDSPFDREIQRTTVDSMRRLKDLGHEILVIETIPQAPIALNPLTCLAKAKVLEDCRYVAPTTHTWVELLERSFASRQNRVWTADFDRLVCPFLPICDPVIDGTIVKWDARHITTRYAETLAEPVAAYLHDNGLLPA